MKQEELKFLSSIAQQLSDPILVCSKKFKFTFINKAGEVLLGFSFRDLIGKSPALLLAEPIEESVQKKIIKIVKDGGVWKGKVPLLKKNGRRIKCSVKISLLYDQEEKGYSYLAILNKR